jgi:ribosome maturation factor RimP
LAEKVKDICFDLCEPIISNMGYELVEVDYQKEQNGMNLIFYIDKEDGINITDCEKVTRALDDVLEEANPTNDKPYTLVVSSLGIDRPIKTQRDFERNMGKEIEIKFYAPHPVLKKKSIQGILLGVDDNFVKIDCDKTQVEIERKLIAFITPVIKF